MNECRQCGAPAKNHYCGRVCYHAYRAIHPNRPGPEGRERIRQSKLGDRNPSRRAEVAAKISATKKAQNLTRERSSRWKGGWRAKAGYVFLGDIKRSHVVWVEAHPDDPILPGEHIHHMNHIKDDDRPENLIKLTNSAHAHEHDFGHTPGAHRGWPKVRPPQVWTPERRQLQREAMAKHRSPDGRFS